MLAIPLCVTKEPVDDVLPGMPGLDDDAQLDVDRGR